MFVFWAPEFSYCRMNISSCQTWFVVQIRYSYTNFSVLLVFEKDVLKLSTMIVRGPFLFEILSKFCFWTCVVYILCSGFLYFPNESFLYHLDNDLFLVLNRAFLIKSLFSLILTFANPFAFFHHFFLTFQHC